MLKFLSQLSKVRYIEGRCLNAKRGRVPPSNALFLSPTTLKLKGTFRYSSTSGVDLSENKLESQCDCKCTCDRRKDMSREHSCHDAYVHGNIIIPTTSPQPKFSYHRRILPSSLTQLSSPKGKLLFRDSFLSHNAEAYFPLSEQFINQSEPAYCAVASLIMVLNAFGIDPNIRWKGGWRWYGSEEMILGQCCIKAGVSYFVYSYSSFPILELLLSQAKLEIVSS